MITSARMGWFRERDVGAVELHATSEAAALYRSFGLVPGANPGLRVRL